jgi:predicted dehydrogenase
MKEAKIGSNQAMHRQLISGKRVRYGIVGCGQVAIKHKVAIQKDNHAELRGVFDIDHSKAASFAALYDVEAFSKFHELLSAVDAVIICTPHHTHVNLVKNVLKAGKFAVCEKPLYLSSGEKQLLINTPEITKRLLVVFQNRFHRAVNTLHGHFGKKQPTFISATLRWPRDVNYFSKSAWRGHKRTEGGLLYNQGIHLIDIVLSLFPVNSKVRILSAECSCLTHSIQTEDTIFCRLMIGQAVVNLEFTIAQLAMPSEISFFAATPDRSIKLNGSSFTSVLWKQAGGILVKGKKPNSYETGRDAAYGDGHNPYIQAVSKYILSGKRDDRLAGFFDAARAEDVIAAIYRKAKRITRIRPRRDA